MRSHRAAVLATVMLLSPAFIAACGSSRSSPPDPAPSVASSPVPANRIDDFDLVDTHRFPVADAGVQYRYQDSSGRQADVYIYRGDAPRHGTDTTGALRAEVATFREALPLGVRRGYYTTYSIVSDSLITVRVAGRDYALHRITMAQTREGVARDSYFYLTVVGGEYVKVRITQPPGKFSVARADTFVRAVLEDAVRKM
jgi:hypothetical protein